jgi:hypothetical protein
VLHLVAGPVNANTLLDEARWVVEMWKLAELQGATEYKDFQKTFRKAHLDRLIKEHKSKLNPVVLPEMEGADALTPVNKSVFLFYKGHHGKTQGKVHHLLAFYPLPKIGRVYEVVFQSILNENLSTVPVVKKG